MKKYLIFGLTFFVSCDIVYIQRQDNLVGLTIFDNLAIWKEAYIMRDNYIYVRLTDREKSKIVNIADNKDMTISEIVRQSLRDYIKLYESE